MLTEHGAQVTYPCHYPKLQAAHAASTRMCALVDVVTTIRVQVRLTAPVQKQRFAKLSVALVKAIHLATILTICLPQSHHSSPRPNPNLKPLAQRSPIRVHL